MTRQHQWWAGGLPLWCLFAVLLSGCSTPSEDHLEAQETIRIGVIRVDNHAWWFGGFFNPYDEARLEKNFPRAAQRNRAVRDVPIPLPGARIVKVWDPDPAQAREFAETYRIPQVVDRLEDLVADIDAVILMNARGDGSDHVELIRPFLERGLPSFIDKPFAHTAAEARTIVELARRHDAPIYTSSTLPHVALRRWGDAMADLGPLSTVFAGGPAAHWGGPIHSIIAAHIFLGAPVDSVQNLGDRDRDILHLRASGNRLGVVFTSEELRFDEQPSFHIGVVGEQGYLVTGDIGPFDFQYGAYAFLGKFLEMVRTREPPVPYEDFVQQVEIFEAARISKERGGAVVRLASLHETSD